MASTIPIVRSLTAGADDRAAPACSRPILRQTQRRRRPLSGGLVRTENTRASERGCRKTITNLKFLWHLQRHNRVRNWLSPHIGERRGGSLRRAEKEALQAESASMRISDGYSVSTVPCRLLVRAPSLPGSPEDSKETAFPPWSRCGQTWCRGPGRPRRSRRSRRRRAWLKEGWGGVGRGGVFEGK